MTTLDVTPAATGPLLPTLAGESIGRGDITLAPATVTFLEFAEAANTACR